MVAIIFPRSVIPKDFFFLYGTFQKGDLSGQSSRKITCGKVRLRPENWVLAPPKILSLETVSYSIRRFRTAACILIFLFQQR